MKTTQWKSSGVPTWATRKVLLLSAALIALLSCQALPNTSLPAPTASLPPSVTPAPTATSIPPTKPPTLREMGNELIITLPGGVEMTLLRVPAGEFLMGSADSDALADIDEKPQHKVMLDEYWIGKYEVTNAQFAAYAQAQGLSWSVPAGKEKHPVVSVSWDDAVAFCKWLSEASGRTIRLPSEAEWEKAARGTDGRIYPWGKQSPDSSRLNFNNEVGNTTEVGNYSPAGDSPYDAADMAGNVWEWTTDWYDEKYYATSPTNNPVGPTTGQHRVLRGGSGINNPDYVRAANRDFYNPINRFDGIGFRVAAAAPLLLALYSEPSELGYS